jgi:LacI family transcriptional regulator
MKKKNPTTIKDIAAKVGVSATTVSMVLNNPETPRVSRERRRQVLKACEELDYRPNFAARMLQKKESNIIGLTVESLKNPFFSELAQGVVQRAKELGYSVLLASVKGGIEDQRSSIRNLLDYGVDGLILSSVFLDDPCIEELSEMDVPFLLALRQLRKTHSRRAYNFVGVDNYKGSCEIIEHLASLGHASFQVLAGPQNVSTGYNRLLGTLDTFDKLGIDFDRDTSLRISDDFYKESGMRFAADLVKSGELPSVIVAHSDYLAIGIITALLEAGYKVPEDVAVVGFDNIEMSSLPGVSLTSVSHNKNQVGYSSVDLLLRTIKTRQIQQMILDPHVIVRNSSALPLRFRK